LRDLQIIYLATVRMPGRRAHSIQIIRTCEALQRLGAKTILIVPKRRKELGENLVSFYGLSVRPTVIKVPTIDLLEKARNKENAYLILVFTFYLFALPLLIILKLSGKTVIYLRERILLLLTWLTKPFHLLPTVYEMHELPKFTGIMRKIQKIALHTCKKIVTISKFQEKLLKKTGFPESRITVIHDAADERIYIREESREDLRRRLNLPINKIIITYSGQLSRWKNPEFIVDALKYVKNENVVLLFVGGSREDIKRLRKYAERVNVKEKIILKGYVRPSEVGRYLKASDILIHYSMTIGDMASFSPLKLFEYMLSGKPLLAPDYPYIKEIIQENVNGFLFNHTDPRSLAKLIEKVLKMDEEEVRKIVERAKSIAEKEYTYTARAKKILETITQGM